MPILHNAYFQIVYPVFLTRFSIVLSEVQMPALFIILVLECTKLKFVWRAFKFLPGNGFVSQG